MARTLDKRWIAKEMERLDPNVDFERIWLLDTSYHIDMFQLSFFFAYLFPHFQMTARQAQTVYRGGKGALITAPESRLDTQNRNMLLWWQFGPKHPETIKSVGRLNTIHAAIARQFPGAFAVQGDYIYAIGVLMAAAHVFQKRLGLKGYSDKAKIAGYKFWSEMVPLFRSEGNLPLQGWPESFEAVLQMMEEYESRHWQYHEEGRATCEAAIRQFGELNFPKTLRGLARAMILTMYPDHIVRTFRLKRPNVLSRWLIIRFFRLMIFYSTRVLPDPETTIWARLYASKKATGTMFAPADEQSIPPS